MVARSVLRVFVLMCFYCMYTYVDSNIIFIIRYILLNYRG